MSTLDIPMRGLQHYFTDGYPKEPLLAIWQNLLGDPSLPVLGGYQLGKKFEDAVNKEAFLKKYERPGLMYDEIVSYVLFPLDFILDIKMTKRFHPTHPTIRCLTSKGLIFDLHVSLNFIQS